MYFADPYCAWQKGTNENLNGLLREFYPKGHNLDRVSEKTLKKNLALINARPKKVLNFKKPIDLFNENLAKCCTQFDNSSQFITIKTQSYSPGGTISLRAEDLVTDFTGLSVNLIASESAEIVYNILMPSAELAQYPDEQDLIDLLLEGSAYFFEASNDIVVRKFLSPGTKYTLIAIAVDKTGKYGPLFKEEYETNESTKSLIDTIMKKINPN